MAPDPGDRQIAGWAVSGAEENIKAPILYVTDGLLKERLFFDDNLIAGHTKSSKPTIFMIDEVHERSVNIDLCLALFARLLTEKPHLRSKIKIIISSATLDTAVPDLFRKIPNILFAEYEMPTNNSLHQIKEFRRPGDNLFELVSELYGKRERQDQILCFVSSAGEVHSSCKMLGSMTSGAIVAYPLVQTQSPIQQQKFIEEGSVFVSTTVAETSLTFPSLRYVIDTTMINMPIYDLESRHNVLKEQLAAESTLKQRRGRVGRTKEGEYYNLSSLNAKRQPYPTAQICQTDLSNIEFAVRKSPLDLDGLHSLKKYLPNPPDDKRIDAAIQEMQNLGRVNL
jgi:HrpA-like RNA helicase